eukprot:4596528-Pyramimonas_sp.AAC.2
MSSTTAKLMAVMSPGQQSVKVTFHGFGTSSLVRFVTSSCHREFTGNAGAFIGNAGANIQAPQANLQATQATLLATWAHLQPPDLGKHRPTQAVAIHDFTWVPTQGGYALCRCTAPQHRGTVLVARVTQHRYGNRSNQGARRTGHYVW